MTPIRLTLCADRRHCAYAHPSRRDASSTEWYAHGMTKAFVTDYDLNFPRSPATLPVLMDGVMTDGLAADVSPGIR